MSDGIDPALAAAARHERDRRAASYPAKIRDGANAEALSIDYQCWVAIAEWLESERFRSFAGGADPDRDDAPIIRWPELEAAAERGVASAESAIAKQEAKRIGNAGQLAELYVRRARLIVIHRKVAARRASIDAINAEFSRPNQQEIAA